MTQTEQRTPTIISIELSLRRHIVSNINQHYPMRLVTGWVIPAGPSLSGKALAVIRMTMRILRSWTVALPRPIMPLTAKYFRRSTAATT